MTEIAIISSPPESHEKRARRLFDEMARNIGREAVNHLKAMYPGALKAVPKTAELSLTNHIRNDINWRMRPLLMAMIALHQEWESESAEAVVNPAPQSSYAGIIRFRGDEPAA